MTLNKKNLENLYKNFEEKLEKTLRNKVKEKELRGLEGRNLIHFAITICDLAKKRSITKKIDEITNLIKSIKKINSLETLSQIKEKEFKIYYEMFYGKEAINFFNKTYWQTTEEVAKNLSNGDTDLELFFLKTHLEALLLQLKNGIGATLKLQALKLHYK